MRGTVRHFSHKCIPVKGTMCILYLIYICTGGRSIWLVVSYGMDACFRGFCGLFHQSKKGNVCVSASSQQWKCARLWMDSRLRTWRADYLPCILVLSISFSPFHRFFPQKLSFNSFEGGISWITFFCRMGFSISDLYKCYIGKSKIAFLEYSCHFMNQIGFVISPWNKYNIKWVLCIYPSYATLKRNKYVFDQMYIQCPTYNC